MKLMNLGNVGVRELIGKTVILFWSKETVVPTRTCYVLINFRSNIKSPSFINNIKNCNLNSL